MKNKTIVAFTATWCGPCKQLKPTITEVSDKFNVIHVDVDAEPDLAKQYGVMAVPTLVFVSEREDATIKESGRLMNPSPDALKAAAKIFFG